MSQNQGESSYPVQFSVEYPETRSRLTALVRILLAIPIIIIAALVSGQAALTGDRETDEAIYPFIAGGGLWFPVILMVLFRRKYPRWWFDWNVELSRFLTRVTAYFILLRDEYPSTDEQQAVRLDFEYPDVERQLNRFLPLVKWLLAIPHYIVLIPLTIIAAIFTVIAWFAILIVGSYPRGMFNFVEGTYRWYYRVVAYAFMLNTDRYPPFRMSP